MAAARVPQRTVRGGPMVGFSPRGVRPVASVSSSSPGKPLFPRQPPQLILTPRRAGTTTQVSPRPPSSPMMVSRSTVPRTQSHPATATAISRLPESRPPSEVSSPSSLSSRPSSLGITATPTQPRERGQIPTVQARSRLIPPAVGVLFSRRPSAGSGVVSPPVSQRSTVPALVASPPSQASRQAPRMTQTSAFSKDREAKSATGGTVFGQRVSDLRLPYVPDRPLRVTDL